MQNIIKQLAAEKKVIRSVIIGDSIGDGSSADTTADKWVSRLSEKIEAQYGVKLSVTNLAVGGTESLFGYHTLKRLSEEARFDLVFVCHGENDPEPTFALRYEVLLRGIRRKWPDTPMVSFLESSQKTYTNKINTIIRLADKYGCGVVDTIKAFADTGRPYAELSVPDGVHINNEGALVYADAVYNTLSAMPEIKPLPQPDSEEVKSYDYYRFVPKYEMQYKLADYRLVTSAEHISFDCLKAPIADEFTVEINGETVLKDTFKQDFPFVWERAFPLKNVKGEKQVRVILNDETDTALFRGIILMGADEKSIAFSTGYIV